jgi:hypothetical protein
LCGCSALLVNYAPSTGGRTADLVDRSASQCLSATARGFCVNRQVARYDFGAPARSFDRAADAARAGGMPPVQRRRLRGRHCKD